MWTFAPLYTPWLSTAGDTCKELWATYTWLILESKFLHLNGGADDLTHFLSKSVLPETATSTTEADFAVALQTIVQLTVFALYFSQAV